MDYNNMTLAEMYGPVNTPGQPGDQIDLAAHLARLAAQTYLFPPSVTSDPAMMRQQLQPMMGVPNSGAWNGGDLLSAANNPQLRNHMVGRPEFFQRR